MASEDIGENVLPDDNAPVAVITIKVGVIGELWVVSATDGDVPVAMCGSSMNVNLEQSQDALNAFYQAVHSAMVGHIERTHGASSEPVHYRSVEPSE